MTASWVGLRKGLICGAMDMMLGIVFYRLFFLFFYKGLTNLKNLV